MTPTPRGLAPINQVCEKHGAHLGARLRAERVPGGAAPFPDSPEEAAWLAGRETLVITALRGDHEGIVLAHWSRAEGEGSAERRVPRAELDAWAAELDRAGGWSGGALAALPHGDARILLEHEAYEYFDEDPDSLDLHSWKPPRHARRERAREGGDAATGQALLALYGRLLPEAAVTGSGLARAFSG